MHYILGITDKRLNRPILKEAHVDHHGVKLILERLTDLDEVGRNEFLRKLIGVGLAVYKAKSSEDELPYEITAVKR